MKVRPFLCSKIICERANQIITKLPLSISITALFINQIVIILEKEKTKAILKIINGKPLTKREGKYVRNIK